jgi:hypothetical protein
MGINWAGRSCLEILTKPAKMELAGTLEGNFGLKLIKY